VRQVLQMAVMVWLGLRGFSELGFLVLP